MAELLEIILRSPVNFIGSLVLIFAIGIVLLTIADKFSPYESGKEKKKERVPTGRDMES